MALPTKSGGGKTKVSGTSYSITGGKTKVAGTGYDVKFRGELTSILVSDGVTIEWQNYPYAYQKITEYSVEGGAFTQITRTGGNYVTKDIHAGDVVTIKSTLTAATYAGSGSASCRIVYNNTEVVAYGSATGTVYTFVAGVRIVMQGSTDVTDGYAIYITNQ